MDLRGLILEVSLSFVDVIPLEYLSQLCRRHSARVSSMKFVNPSRSALRKFLNVRWEASVYSMSHSMLRVFGV